MKFVHKLAKKGLAYKKIKYQFIEIVKKLNLINLICKTQKNLQKHINI